MHLKFYEIYCSHAVYIGVLFNNIIIVFLNIKLFDVKTMTLLMDDLLEFMAHAVEKSIVPI